MRFEVEEGEVVENRLFEVVEWVMVVMEYVVGIGNVDEMVCIEGGGK